MRLTIIPAKSLVSVNADVITLSEATDAEGRPIDTSRCGAPSNVSALQWYHTKGWIEFNTAGTLSQGITELPHWAYGYLELYESCNPKTLAQGVGMLENSGE